MRPSAWIPLCLFGLLLVGLAVGLFGGDPKNVPSVFIDRPAPEIALSPIEGYREQEGGITTDLLKTGEPSLVNVWASYCGPCIIEHPQLVSLRRQGIRIFGFNYRDKPDAARAFLEKYGDPFMRVGADPDGRAGIDWGVYGMPETFVVDGQGRIRYKHVGPLTPEIVEKKILPALEAAANVNLP